MQTQTSNIIAQHTKAICILSMIAKAEFIIKSSEPYLDESRKHLCYYEASAKHYRKVIAKYCRIKERLVMAYDNVSYKVFHMQLPIIAMHESMLPY